MGSQRHDIFYALEAFADYIDRHPIDRRPAFWAQYVDIWGEARGEIGIPTPTDPDDPLPQPAATVFTLLVPWFGLPLMAEAWLVIDRLDDGLWVVDVRATESGLFSPIYKIVYRLEDDGSITPREPVPISMPPEIGAGVAAAMKSRAERKLWDAYYDFNSIMPVVDGMLNR